MQERDRAAAGCLDDERLAAFVDGGLTAGERAGVERHLASCRTCFAVYAEAVKTVQAMEAELGLPAGAPVAPPAVGLPAPVASIAPARKGRLTRWVLAGGGLAAAAAVVLAVWWPRATDVPTGEMAALVEAAAAYRPFEGRLTGGFKFAPVTASRSTRVGDAPPDVRIATAALEKAVGADPSPARRAAFARGAVLTGDLDRAVSELGTLLRDDGGNGSLWTDLSAALLAQATRQPGQRLELAARALDAAERATELQPTLAEAWFNRALALEALSQVGAARQAWSEYLTHESDEHWLDEGQRRLRRLGAGGTSRLPRSDPDGPIPVAASTSSEHSPATLRATFETRLLPEWISAAIAGNGPSGDSATRPLCVVAQELERRTGDRLPSDLAREAGCQAPDEDGSRDARIARGLRLYFDGVRHYETDDLEAARRSLEESSRRLAALSPPLQVLPEIQLAVIDYRGRDLTAASRRLDRAIAVARERGYQSALARARWLRGLASWQRLAVSESNADLRAAAAIYGQLGEEEKLGQVLRTQADHLRTLGNTSAAWRQLDAAFRSAQSSPRPLSAYLVQLEAAVLARQEGWERSALRFHDAAVEASIVTGLTGARAEALILRAQSYARLGLANEASRDIDEARSLFDPLRDPDLDAGVVLAQAMVRGGLPTSGDGALDQAIGRLAALDAVDLPRILLWRGRSYLRRKQFDRASADFEEGLRILKRRYRRTDEPELRSQLQNVAWEIWEASIESALPTSGADGAAAFVRAEQARNMAWSAFEVPDVTPSNVASALPYNAYLMAYVTLPERLLVWRITRQRVEYIERRITPRGLERLVDDAWNPNGSQQAAVANRLALSQQMLPFSPLPEQATVTFLLDGPLHRAPVAALAPVGSGLLIERHAVAVTPSVRRFLARLRRAPSFRPRSALLIGNPAYRGQSFDLPPLAAAQGEVEQLAAFYPGATVLTEERATSAAMLAAIGRHDLFHFAGHAVAHRSLPELSALVMAGPDDAGAVLGMHHLAGRPLRHVRLAVLAACRGAGPDGFRSGGVVGLASALLEAGVTDVIAASRDVDDAQTARLMRWFHEAYAATGVAADSLRAAQLRALRASDGARDMNWASFSVFGAAVPRAPAGMDRAESWRTGR